ANRSCRQRLRMFSNEIKHTQCALYRVQKIALLTWRTKGIHILLKLLHHHELHLYRQKYQEDTAKYLYFNKYSARRSNVKRTISIGEICHYKSELCYAVHRQSIPCSMFRSTRSSACFME